MKNTYIAGIILIVLVAGVIFVLGMGKKAVTPVPETPITACTMEAKLCPDGSYVGRSGPKCEFAACPEAKSNQTVKVFSIIGQNFSFTPSLIKVKKGDKVKIIFENTSGFHDFKIDAYGVATPQTQSPSTEVLEFTANKTGSFEYYCSVGNHRSMGMKGTLVVE